jgi:hypothetical protein
MKSYKVRANIDVYDNGKTDILYEIEPDVFVEEETFVKWAKEKADVLEAEVAKSKTLSKKARVKAFLKKVVEKQKAKNKSYWQELYEYHKPADIIYLTRKDGQVRPMRGYSKGVPKDASPRLYDTPQYPGIDPVEQLKINNYVALGIYLLLRGYDHYRKPSNFPKPSSEFFKVGFAHPDISSLVKDDPHFPYTAEELLGKPVKKDLYDNNQYLLYFDCIMGFDVSETTPIKATRCEGGRLMLAIGGWRGSPTHPSNKNKEYEPYAQHIAITLLTDKEDIADNDGFPVKIHWRTDFGQADDPDRDARTEKLIRAYLPKADWLRDYAKSMGLKWI